MRKPSTSRLFYYCLLIGSLLTACGTGQVPWSLKKLQSENYQEVRYFFDKQNSLVGAPDRFPMYPDGLAGFQRDLKAEIKYSDKEKREMVEGKVTVRYIVNVEGKIKEVDVLESSARGLDKQVIKGLRNLKGRWFPGLINGHPVEVTYLQTFEFSLY